jgi:kinesin family protein 6/9
MPAHLFTQGEANRVISEHQLNRESSRSHAIFTINLVLRTTNDLSGTVVVSGWCCELELT